jgi:hypothetical protein
LTKKNSSDPLDGANVEEVHIQRELCIAGVRQKSCHFAHFEYIEIAWGLGLSFFILMWRETKLGTVKILDTRKWQIASSIYFMQIHNAFGASLGHFKHDKNRKGRKYRRKEKKKIKEREERKSRRLRHLMVQ